MRAEMKTQIEAAFAQFPEAIGPRLGVLCIRGDVPLAVVEGIIGNTNRVTLRRWVTGKVLCPQHPLDRRKLRRLVWTLGQALDTGILPMDGAFNPQAILPLWAESISKL